MDNQESEKQPVQVTSELNDRLGAFLEARKILDSHAVPKGSRSAYMNRQTFVGLGGTVEHWDSLPETDLEGVKLIHA